VKFCLKSFQGESHLGYLGVDRAILLKWILHKERGARGIMLVEALCYKPEGRGFDCR
jgi:hypothetical protein